MRRKREEVVTRVVEEAPTTSRCHAPPLAAAAQRASTRCGKHGKSQQWRDVFRWGKSREYEGVDARPGNNCSKRKIAVAAAAIIDWDSRFLTATSRRAGALHWWLRA